MKYCLLLLIFSLFYSCSKSSDKAQPVPPVVPPVIVPPQPLTLWNGESAATGVGWVSPTFTDMAIATEDTSSASGTKAIAVHMAHPNFFLEAGWQWSDWTNVVSTNFSPFSNLTLSVRFAGLSLPNDLQISLASPGDHKTTQRISLKNYNANIYDGAWHQLTIPLKDFYTIGMPFDPAHAIQIILGTWNDNKDFTVMLDDIALN